MMNVNTGRPGLAMALFAAVALLVTLTGGSSFSDVLGQPVARAGSLILLSIAIGAGLRFDLPRYRVPLWLMAAMILLVTLQLIPLPPDLWLALPGRDMFDLSSLLPDTASIWRPLAIVPDAARNALFALLVPFAALLLIGAVPRAQLALTVPLLIVMVGLSSIVGTLQFAGGGFDNPLINDRVGFASGLFSNRNHQALFLAIGIAAAMHWATMRPFLPARAIAAGVIVGWFVLMILATGSRAGLLLGLVALIGGGSLIIGALRRGRVRVTPRTAALIAIVTTLALAAIIFVSIQAGRAESIDRLNQAVIGEDMRVRAAPVVLDMVRHYLPSGAGQGSFAALFKVVEPDALLKPTYFNHAHNDFLEVLIEAGIAGGLLLLACLAWLTRQVWAAWRHSPAGEVQRARLGSIIFLLVLLASTVDYPARTPLIMVTLVLATAWLVIDRLPSALPAGK